ncbi:MULTISPECIES: hypothetical protein [Mycobacteriaceae]|uniref:hypothetical protein n=1 Tax=Mycobacteriaceae TaxID=1762 RepID=UPI0009939230|nr:MULTISPECIES: hypothetical protein [Mycobacteriaceae]MDO3058477.1 hypothetical protein [Mycobacteroides abscessus subsp. abscessus]MDO3277987.1 hypothetical protein [Mycobacteroides abscessus subsp. abscessus]
MVKVELTKETEHFPEGSVIAVDENSARVLIARKEAKLVKQTEPEVVESGGERARAINAAAKAKGDSDGKAETGPETPDKAPDSK